MLTIDRNGVTKRPTSLSNVIAGLGCDGDLRNNE
jgi:hypothetical protein